MVFITASPLLARNISKMYHRVLNYLKSMMYEKEKKAKSSVAKTSAEKVVVHEDTPEDEFEEIGEKDGSDSKKDERKENNSHMVTEAMEGFDLKILDDAEKEIEQMLDDININEDSNEVPNSFYKVGIDDFPLFLTLKEFLYLMDSLMPTSFFARNVDNLIRAGIKKTNGKKAFYRHKDTTSANRLHDSLLFRETFSANYTVELSSDEEEEHETIKVSAKEEDLGNTELKDDHNIFSPEDLVSEVDYQDFVDVFYPTYQKNTKYHWKLNIEANIVWQKIRNMDLQYASKYSDNVDQVALDVYRAYKKWKESSGCYDLNDLYDHLYKSHEIDMVASNLVDFLYLDEIQDIPEHLLNYLRKFGNKYFYFSGDNAQNITKGVTFKFEDLAKTYSSYKKSKLKTDFFALKINFRSHQQILDLANNIVYLLKMFFPETLEYLPSEKSNMTGATPVIMPLDSTEDQLIQFMKDTMNLREETVISEQSDAKFVSSNYKFANSQVFITRDYRSKQALLEKYSNAIVLTILEAKGMEFDDVILYNYFSDTASNKAMLMYGRSMEISTKRVSEPREEMVASDRIVYYKKCQDDEGVYYTEYEIGIDKVDLRKYDNDLTLTERSDNADELKLLYVAITRARKRVLIFDEPRGNMSKSSRNVFDQLWLELNLVKSAFSEVAVKEFKSSAPVEKVREKKKWIRDGIEYMQKSHYDFAELCFRSAEFEKGVTLANLCKNAINLKRDYLLLNAVNSQNAEEQKEIEENRIRLRENIRDLADHFMRNGWFEQAIQSYSVGGYLALCADKLSEFKHYKRAADYYFELGRYDEAMENYKQASDYMGMISCLQSEKNMGNLLMLFNLIKDKVGKADLAALKAIAKRRLREEIISYNKSLITGDSDLSEKKGRLDMQQLAEEIEDIEQARIEKDGPIKNEASETASKAGFDKPLTILSDSEFDDGVGSFKEVEIDEVMSNQGSFEFVNSEIDELEKLSESFVDVSVQGQKVVTNSSLFEDFTTAMDKHFSFKENEMLMKAINICQSNYDDLIKTKNNTQKDDGEKIFELDMIEISESIALDIIKFVNNCGAYTLRLLIERKLGINQHLLTLMISYLYQTTPQQHAVAKWSLLDPTQKKKLNLFDTITANCNEIRRLATMSFVNVLKKCDQKAVKILMEQNDMEARIGMNIMVLLGYFRQLAHLLSLPMASKLLATYGEIQTLIMLKISNNEVEIFDKEALLTDLIVAPGIKKLAVVYAYFEGHFDVIKSSLYYFSIHYLWSKKTYLASTFEKELEEIAIRNELLALALSILKDFISENYEEGFKKVQEINISQIARGNTLEGGYLAGVLLNCFYFFNKNFLSPKILSQKSYKDCQSHLKPYLNIFKSSILYKTKQNLFLEGMLLSMSISLIPAGCPPLALYTHAGTLVHRSSLVMAIIADITSCDEDADSGYMIGSLKYDVRAGRMRVPGIFVADCGQEFYNVRIEFIFTLLSHMAFAHIRQIGRFILNQTLTRNQSNSWSWVMDG